MKKGIKVNMTFHSQYERRNRLFYMTDVLNGDFGETVAVDEQYDEVADRYAVCHLTSRGALLVRALDGKLITAYFPTVKKARSVYCNCMHVDRMPEKLFKTVAWMYEVYGKNQPKD